MLEIYGLKNCDTCRKALKWLQQNGIDHEFHDLKSTKLTQKQIATWLEHVPLETLINRRGTTWRRLPEQDKAKLTEKTAGKLAVDHPSLLKRPVFEAKQGVFVGFGSEQQKRLLNL